MREGTKSNSLGTTWRLVLAVGITVVALAPLGTGHNVSAATHDDWSMFHHDQAHTGVSPDTAISASTAAGLTQKWARTVGTASGHPAVIASPAVVFNATLNQTVVYDVDDIGDVRAMDAATGTSIWTQTLSATVQDSPAIDGNTLYVGTSKGTLYALDATTGAIQCSATLPVVPSQTTPPRIEDSPVVGHIDSSGPVVFFGDSGTGEKTNGGHEWAYTGYGNTAGNCQQKWSFNGFAAKGGKGTKSGSWSPPALAQDATGRWLDVFGSSNPDDSVYALDASDGHQVWRFQTAIGKDLDVGAGAAIGAPGVNGFTDGVVYIAGKSKIEYALNLLTGTQIWSFNMALDSGLTTNSVSTTALDGNNVFVGYSNYLYDLDATTGAVVWRSAALASTILASPAVSGAAGDKVVFIGDSTTGNENAYRMSDGTLLYSLATGHNIFSSAAVSDGMVFFGSGGGSVIALG